MLKLSKTGKQKEAVKYPPARSKGLLSDFKFFLLNKPKISTLIKFNSELERQNYCLRIMQRIGIDVDSYTILNIHKIGIEVPVGYIFEELLQWNGDATCWPNYIAKVERIDDSLENIKIFLLGWTKYIFGLKNGFLGLNFIPLFKLKAIKIQHQPNPTDLDNARYMLYKSSGGYPIGIFSMYVRSSIDSQQEVEKSQLFLMVGFDFYGKKEWLKRNLIKKIWESIHNRVTTNIMNRFKQLCEWRFEKIKHGYDF